MEKPSKKLADGEKEKYFITSPEEMSEIYLKKPKAQPNPFDYSMNPKKTWKPTELEIIVKE